eukprot:Skav226967  [mRNA]  locus=scaffold51:319032:320696:- [translate_table: standard]
MGFLRRRDKQQRDLSQRGGRAPVPRRPRHAVFVLQTLPEAGPRVDGAGDMLLMQDSSSNGTWINGTRMTADFISFNLAIGAAYGDAMGRGDTKRCGAAQALANGWATSDGEIVMACWTSESLPT